MITASKATENSINSQLNEIEGKINDATAQGKFECEIPLLTEDQQTVLKDNGFNIYQTATKQGMIWIVKWPEK